MGKVNEQLLILLDIDQVFNSDELALVQDVGQTEAPDVEEELVEA